MLAIYMHGITSKDNDSFKRIHIYMNQIFEYVKRRVNFIENIIEHRKVSTRNN